MIIVALKTGLKSITRIISGIALLVIFISGLLYTSVSKAHSLSGSGYPIRDRGLIRNKSSNNVSDTLILEGKYNGKNLYLVNPMEGPGKCSFHKIFVNGKIPAGPEKYGTGIIVNLDSCRLLVGDNVKIEILYEKGQLPKTLNPEVLK